MPRVVIVTDSGDEVGEVPTYVTNIGTRRNPRFGHGWDGIEFERLWAEAQRRENVATMVAEGEASV